MFKKKIPSSNNVVMASGRSVSSYFMPALIVSALLVLLLIFLTSQMMERGVDKAAAKVADASANGLIQGISGAIASRQSVLFLLSTQKDVLEALRRKDEKALQQLGKEYATKIPGIDELYLVAKATRTNGSHVGEDGSFATMDMVRRVIKSGQIVDVEAHQLNSKQPIIAIAVPVTQGERLIGAVYAAYSIDSLRDQITSISDEASAFAVRQLSGGRSPILFKAQQFKDGKDVSYRKIPGTLWEVGIQVGAIEVGSGILIGLGLLILLALALVMYFMQTKLDKDIKHDLDLVRQLTASILNHSGSSTVGARLKDTQEVIEGLTSLAKANYVSAQLAGKPTADDLADSAEKQTRALAAVDTSSHIGELPESIFRAYDIRGIVDETLTVDIARLLGQALGTLALEHGEKSLIIGRDVRHSSQELAEGLAAGILATGCDVIDLGEVPTPLVYYATNTLHSHSGVMVTGSHNPANYNGFKITIGGQPLAEQALQDLREKMLIGDFKTGSGKMSQNHHLSSDYIRRITEDVQLAEPRKVVVDGGNGVAGPLTVALLRELGCEVIELFCEPDGDFPNHHPDPGKPENLASLVLEVQAQQADLGIALDGDGDRLGVIDNSGKLVTSDMLIMLLASDILQRHPGVDIIYDVKSSGYLASHILANGGRPIMWKTGHTRIKAKMKETGALLGGEFSGHIFIKERWFGFDDAAYTAARLLEILCADTQPVARFFVDLPGSFSTPEIQMNLKEGENFALMEAMKREVDFDDANIIDIDGLRIEFSDGWGLVRPSNTQPALVFRFEGKTKLSLDNIQNKLRDLVKSVAPGHDIPF